MAQYVEPRNVVTVSVTIRQPMNDHGTVTVELSQTNETRYLVDYDSDHLRQVFGSLSAGTTLPVQMTRVGTRSNVWRVTGLPGAPKSTDEHLRRQRPKSN